MMQQQMMQMNQMMMSFMSNPQFLQNMQNNMMNQAKNTNTASSSDSTKPTSNTPQAPTQLPLLDKNQVYSLKSLTSATRETLGTRTRTPGENMFSLTMNAGAKYPYNPFHRDHAHAHKVQTSNPKFTQPRTPSLLNQSLSRKKEDSLNFLFRRNDPRDFGDEEDEEMLSNSQRERDSRIYHNSAVETNRASLSKSTVESKNKQKLNFSLTLPLLLELYGKMHFTVIFQNPDDEEIRFTIEFNVNSHVSELKNEVLAKVCHLQG